MFCRISGFQDKVKSLPQDISFHFKWFLIFSKNFKFVYMHTVSSRFRLVDKARICLSKLKYVVFSFPCSVKTWSRNTLKKAFLTWLFLTFDLVVQLDLLISFGNGAFAVGQNLEEPASTFFSGAPLRQTGAFSYSEIFKLRINANTWN